MKPLCVDLDGTLIRTDLLFESFISHCKKNPFSIFKLTYYFFKSKSLLKSKLSGSNSIDVENLPYCPDVLAFLKEESKRRDLILVTGSNIIYAQKVANHLRIFQGVIASSEDINLTGSRKAKHLEAKYGLKGFDYVGNCSHDVPVWKSSHKGYSVVKNNWGLDNVDILPIKKNRFNFNVLTKLLRIHQWAKNILIFVPLILSHQFNSATNIMLALKAFISFCLMASSVYILNDILDVENDRKHPEKRFRPIPSGDIQLPIAITAFVLLSTSSVFMSLQLNSWTLALYPLFYLVLNLFYSAYLKQLLIVDICVLTSFYLIRLFYGGAATGFELSYWMVSFSFFIFFSLAVIKRYIEIHKLFHLQGRKSSTGRAYQFDDMPILLGIGIATGIASVIVLSLYFQFGAKQELYSNPKYLWGIEVLILVWICNIWVRAVRGKVDDDPVKFALTDKFSLVTAGFIVILGMMAV